MYSKSIATDVQDIAAERLPKPVGYKVLIAVPKLEEKTKGGIYVPDDLKKREETATIFGLVVSLGESAYADAERFPTGSLCKQGDWVMFRSYAGTRFSVDDIEFRLINDDTVEAVIDDPTGIARAG